MPKPGVPIFNHVGLSVPADLLDEEGRRQIVDFYSEVLGWQELPTETVDRYKLVMMAYRIDQFVFLIADDTPMTTARLDHFGMGVATEEELDTFLARAKAYQQKDARVDIIDKKVERHPGITLTSCYIRYLLPLMIEIQYWNYEAA